MDQSAEDRVVELEIVLEDLLDCFDQGPEGVEATSMDEELFFLDQPTTEAIERATDVLERGE
jgi:hypothetical protein